MAYDEVYSLQSEEISSAKLKSGSKTSCEPGGICPVNNSLQTFISHSLTIPSLSVWESVVSRGEDVEIMTRICPVQLCLQSSASATYEQLPKPPSIEYSSITTKYFLSRVPATWYSNGRKGIVYRLRPGRDNR